MRSAWRFLSLPKREALFTPLPGLPEPVPMPTAAPASGQKTYERPQLKSAAGSFEVMPPCALLHNYMDTDEERRGFVNSMAEVQVKQQEVIMRQGDKGNNFYLIKSGTCDVWMADSAGERRNVRSLTAGSWCGELSLLTGKPRSASIMATSPEVTLLMVNRRAFNAALGDKIVKKRAEWVPFLRLLPIFAELSEGYELGLLADACREVRYAAGATMHEVGTPGDNKFFIVREGTVVAVAGGPAESTKYGPQAYFGHVELLQNSKHQETRRAETAVWCATFRKEDFLKLVPLHAFVRDAGQQQLALKAEGAPTGSKMRGRRFGEAAEATTGVLTGKVATGKKKTTEQVARIMGAVSRNVIFSRLNEMQLTMLQEAMMEHTIHPGQNVITQGEKGNHFFIVDSGELDAFVQGEDPESHPVRVRGFRAGESFGELALMYNCPRTATIQAATPVVLWSLDRVSFRTIVLEANTKKAASYESFLEKVPLLAPLDKDQRNRMVDALEEVTYAQDDAIITEGEEGTHFYVIARGEVVITKAGQGELARRREGDYFGELSLKTGAPTMASVTAAAAGTTVVRMDRGAFQRLIGPLGELLAMRKYTASGAELQQQASDADAESTGGASAGIEMPNEHKYIKAQRPMTLSDFTVTKGTLGEGAFGTVRRCRVRSTGEVFALKQMQKADIVSMGQVEHIMQETQILDRIAHPFVTNKWAGFVTPSNLILIMEFCPGGDLFDQLYKHKRFSVPDTRIYVMLPLEYMHSMGIVHRDLKLENILVAQDGALKLTDFGFAKVIKYRSWTLCGTPEYLAPEIILEKGHSKAVDYWAMGVLFYEMLNGHSPFEAEDHLATYQKILDGTVHYPPEMNIDAADLISKLLQKDISKRYGNLRDGCKDIKEHPFYAKSGFDWADYAQRGSAFKPPLFDASKYEWLPAERIVTDAKPCKPADSELFTGF